MTCKYSYCRQANVYVERDTPILFDISVFKDYGNLTLYVPTGTRAAYESAQYWRDFGVIEEYDPQSNGIEDINADHAHSITANNAVYTIDGRLVTRQAGDKLPRGLYVIGGKKMLVK
jgi:hypothetical protein